MVPLAWSDLREKYSRQGSEEAELGKAVSYLAPSVTWKYEFHLLRGLGLNSSWHLDSTESWLCQLDSSSPLTLNDAFFLAFVSVGKREACAWSYISPSVYPPDGCQLFVPGLLTLAKQYLVFVSSLLSSGLFTCCFSVVFLCWEPS